MASVALAILGASVLAVPIYGFLPLGSVLAGLFVVAAAGRAMQGNKKQSKIVKSPRVRNR